MLEKLKFLFWIHKNNRMIKKLDKEIKNGKELKFTLISESFPEVEFKDGRLVYKEESQKCGSSYL